MQRSLANQAGNNQSNSMRLRANFISPAVALLIVLQPSVKSALFANVAHIFEIRAIERSVRLLRFDANRATDIVVSQHLEGEVFSLSERRALAGALRFARLAKAASPNSRNAFVLARLYALLGEEGHALEELEGPPPSDQSGHWTVLAAVLNERIGAHGARDYWSIDGDASASYFLDRSRYLSERDDVLGADESLLRAVHYARSPGAAYLANYRMGLNKMYALNQAEASLPYFRSAERWLGLGPIRAADEFDLHLSYAHALINAHHAYEAISQATRAVELDPESASAHQFLGRAYLDTGSPSQAQIAYASSLRLYAKARLATPGYTYWGLGQTKLALGEKAQAIEVLKLALQAGVDPNLRAYIVGLLADLDAAHER